MHDCCCAVGVLDGADFAFSRRLLLEPPDFVSFCFAAARFSGGVVRPVVAAAQVVLLSCCRAAWR